jgi:Kef-type K+ transport system membrane component KefB
MATYLFATVFALIARIVLGWVDAPILIGCLIAGTVIGAVEYYYLQKDREYDERR